MHGTYKLLSNISPHIYQRTEAISAACLMMSRGPQGIGNVVTKPEAAHHSQRRVGNYGYCYRKCSFPKTESITKERGVQAISIRESCQVFRKIYCRNKLETPSFKN